MLTAGLLALTLSACGTTNWGFPYRADVQQGNWITSEQVAQLQQGMSREQVRFILGTPALQDVFHTDRWDYTYFNKPGYGAEQQRKFTVWFEGDSLTRWEGDEQPDRQPFQKADTGMQQPAKSNDSANEAEKPDTEADRSTRNRDSKIEIRPVNPAATTAPQSQPSPEPLR
ncbi:MAG TPA: outer membrane protein assembly factor BamE [Eoetvoesiella sp.]